MYVRMYALYALKHSLPGVVGSELSYVDQWILIRTYICT